jgi:hypothetical protein
MGVRRVGPKDTTPRSIYIHRDILKAPYGSVVDHANGNSLDNRRKNIRICTVGQNNCNSGARRGSASQYCGVGRCGNRWQARIIFEKTYHHLGVFKTEEEAARAYDRAARELHGEFAWQNFPYDQNRACTE